MMRFLIKKLKNLFNLFLRLLYPEKCRCLVCGGETDGNICQSCEEKLVKNDSPHRCARCSRPLIAEENYCSVCRNNALKFDRAEACFVYTGEVMKMIHRFKFRGKKYYADYFSECLFERLKELPKADIVVPVPMHSERIKKRGYNQCDVLAEKLSAKAGIPVCRALDKLVNSPEQVGLDGESRRKNIRDSYQLVKKKDIKCKRIILIDDVLTTGATLSECARMLKLGGADKVYALTLAITQTRVK